MRPFGTKMKILSFGILACLLGGFGWWQANAFSPEQYVEELGSDATPELRRDIGQLARAEGIAQAIQVVARAAATRHVGIDDCHLLLHLIGHEAYQLHANDWDTLFAANSGHICIGGYLHGIEAEIAAAGTKEELFSFCALTKERGLGNGPCYHGAGHSMFERSKHVAASLAFCDGLRDGPEPDLSNCYRGVFSELGNQMLGVDSNTNFPTAPFVEPAQGIDPAHPFALCTSLAEAYQHSCYSQLTKVFYRSADKLPSIIRCLGAAPVRMAEGLCAEILAGIAARNMVDEGTLADAPSLVNAVPSSLQLVALRGIREGYTAGESSHVPLPLWENICASLTASSTQAACFTLPFGR
jgi:hypothetical protein